jgi:ubiquinone/menaquinone biosynthesis C-methylase UbiE
LPEQEAWQLEGNAAQIYEEQKVPSLFRPLAELTLRHVDLHQSDHVVDLACGTGIMGRLAAEVVGSSGRVAGVDLNSGMIEAAKRHSPVTGANMEWHQGDVTALPFPDASFDIAFCQQGLQFFPDKLAALKEIRRVLKSNGSLNLTVWSDLNPYNAAVAGALTQYVSAQVAAGSTAPFEFGNLGVIKKLLIDAGFHAIDTESLVVQRRLGPAEESIPMELAGVPYASDVERLDPPTRNALFKYITDALEKYRVADGLEIPQETHLVRADA